MRIPFFRTARNGWFLQLGKGQINLGPDRDEALKQYHWLMLQEGSASLRHSSARGGVR
jgi:hypothetical protein